MKIKLMSILAEGVCLNIVAIDNDLTDASDVIEVVGYE